ncbi:MAG: hypothetical protein RBU45_09550 [Myxococcota bacterium]|jgi:hypothetical protein|nr:hypothetical protein [Myxococcota bacterium]
MTPAAPLLVALWRSGCTVRLDDTGRLRLRAHGEAPPPELAAAVAEHKAAVVDLLAGPCLEPPAGWTLTPGRPAADGWTPAEHGACIELGYALAAAGCAPAEVDPRAWWPVAAAVEEARASGRTFATVWSWRP